MCNSEDSVVISILGVLDLYDVLMLRDVLHVEASRRRLVAESRPASTTHTMI